MYKTVHMHVFISYLSTNLNSLLILSVLFSPSGLSFLSMKNIEAKWSGKQVFKKLPQTSEQCCEGSNAEDSIFILQIHMNWSSEAYKNLPKSTELRSSNKTPNVWFSFWCPFWNSSSVSVTCSSYTICSMKGLSIPFLPQMYHL